MITYKDNTNHLSWTCDKHTSSLLYAKRFEGTVGDMLLIRQAELISRFLNSIQDSSILDVGAGHGQTMPSLVRSGAIYTAYGSDQNSFETLKKVQQNTKLAFEYQHGSLCALPYPDQTFDHVISVRTMSHVPNWKTFLEELMRIAKNTVIFDFAPASLIWLKNIMLKLKEGHEPGTRDYTTQTLDEIIEFLKDKEFYLDQYECQFVLPLFLHRKAKCKVFYPLERLFQKLNITQHLGGPILVLLKRK